MIQIYKLSPDTIGITKTEDIVEIQIFQINVKEKKLPLSVINTITKGVKYKILFIIKYNDEFCYLIKSDDIFSTEWNDNIVFDFNAINLEIVYENIVKAIIKEENNEKKFNDIIDTKINQNTLEKKIAQLKQKIKNEKQFNRKVELNKELNKLSKELEVLNNE